jgi:hypothetical protein
MQDVRQFRSWVKWLRSHFPSAHPVRVSLVKPEILKDGCGRCYGETRWNDSRASVLVASNLSIEMTIETLCHEWAHVLRDHVPESPLDAPGGHDEVFYTWLGRIDLAWRRHRK